MARSVTWDKRGYRRLGESFRDGNQTAPSCDLVPMRCSRFRQAVSARLDGEDPGVPAGRVDAHLAACSDCRGWAMAARSLPALTEAPLERTSPDPGVLASLLAEARPGRRALISVREWRIVLAVIAAVQLATAWPGVLTGGHASEHLAHELTSLDIGLAVGFLFLAWQPSRAWGALPLVGFLVACLAGASVLDLLSGNALLGREVVHLLEVAGLGCLWMLARRVPRSSVVLRLA
jgi:predicted anti-sigma-YlaC factor YlaD